MPDFAIDKVNFQSKEKCEKELVSLIQTTDRPLKYSERQIVDDIGDPFGSDHRLGRPVVRIEV